MRRRKTILGVCAALALGWLWAKGCSRESARMRQTYDAERVRRGDLRFVLREAGELSPREPILVKSNHRGTLQWIVEDGSWIEKRARLFIVSEDEELKRVTEQRDELLNARQELRLARVKREHSAEIEARKLQSAQRACELERIRYRILTSKPEGGDALIQVHTRLVALEEETNRIRTEYEKAQAAYQAAQDTYLDALDAWQAQKDNILHVQTRIDEYRVEKDRPTDKMQVHELKKHEETAAKLEAAEQELAKLRADLPALLEKLKAAEQARDREKAPRDQAAARLAEREAQEKDIYIQLEIEKRGAQLAQLRLDEEADALTLAEAQRKYKAGQDAFEAGSISRSALDALEADMKTAESRLRIARQKIKIAEEPLPPEALAEATMKLERAEANARNAQEVHDRAMQILDTEIRMLETRVKRLAEDIDYRSRSFPAIIESNLEFARKELELLDEDETARQDPLKAEIARLDEQLRLAQEQPPNIAIAPVSGIANVRQRDSRPLQAGDDVNEEDVVVRLSPPENMEVCAQVNEVNLKQVNKGMKVRVRIPALDTAIDGEIYQVAGVGKDKLEDFSRWGAVLFADVTQFDIRVKLDRTDPGFRQGMSVMVEILVAERPNALWLPLGAVRQADGRFFVLTGRVRRPKQTEIQGEPFAEDCFVVKTGLKEGDTVYVPRVRNL
ncbi:MAG: HlyD family efflux transporter periplasmic adaptor subunit [Kiritimatiellae bacterium]|nr:HlyD family efflux transporter periplasmic adaptor subunit [Kiritimatiellia bacterium]